MPTDLRVLLIEDDDNDALLLLRELESGDYNTTHKQIQTATELHACLDEEAWDLIITDYMMPEFSGLEALGVINGRRLDIPTIMVSGKMGEEHAVEAMRLGAVDFITKDRLSRLVPAIRRELKDAARRKRQAAAERELEEWRKRYRMVVEGIREGISVYKDGRFVFVNQAFAEMTGKSVDELLGSGEIDFYSPEDRRMAFDYHRARMAGKPAPEHYELRATVADGSMRLLEVHETLIDWEGESAALAIIRDITEKKHLEDELRHSNEELQKERESLERKNIALSEILSQLEHEKKEMEQRLLANIDNAVLPIVRRLQTAPGEHQVADLQLLEDALKQVVSPFIGTLRAMSSRLSARELEVCRMIKNGALTKDIAQALNLSPTTISKYREKIRKKLGLTNQTVNLVTYLQSLNE
ncbi:PAS domain S-box protein [candidate division GN15 bacterium]|nr:PAS domain S-box protein [candidate division GN15 bacterium]